MAALFQDDTAAAPSAAATSATTPANCQGAVARFVETAGRVAQEHRALIEQLAERHAANPLQLCKELVERSVLTHGKACQFWADALGVAYVNPFNVELPNDPALQIPSDLAKRAQAVVLSALEGGATVAMADPTNEVLIKSLSKVLGRQVSPVYAHPEEIASVIELHHVTEERLSGTLREVCESLPSLEGGREISRADDIKGMVGSKAFVELFNSVLLTAFRQKASDIHFESGVDGCGVRIRVDGDMQPLLKWPRPVHDAMVVRIKVLCKLDVSQSRLPQDGAFEISFAGRRPAFRASTLPGVFGEKGVLRLLGSLSDQPVPRIGAVGFADSTRNALRRAVLRPNGIILVCGPTGSGKTTTLYACLNEISRPDLNVVTIEDPVEYRLPGISQHQVNGAVGLDFSKILRSGLRQDPDVILIGEIRDKETAQIATEAALTGHLVMSSLHTNNSVQAITRLIELGVEPHMVAPTVVGVLSQRLVRRICPGCKESYPAAPEQLLPHFHTLTDDPVLLHRGRGCPQCRNTGYLGRVGVHEMLEVSEHMRELIARSASPAVILAEARHIGFRSMRYDGLKKALLGWTTLEEVERNTVPDMSDRPIA